jgi:hypothetical protein
VAADQRPMDAMAERMNMIDYRQIIVQRVLRRLGGPNDSHSEFRFFWDVVIEGFASLLSWRRTKIWNEKDLLSFNACVY